MIDIQRLMPNPSTGSAILEIELHPNAMITRQMAKWVLGVFSGICLILGSIFFAAGATPVLGFMGLEIVLLSGAFWITLRNRKIREAIQLSANHLTIRRIDPNGREKLVSFHPYWTQLGFDRSSDQPAPVTLQSKGNSVEVGAFLPLVERRELANTLEAALQELRSPAY
ncbi:MAG: DUF2244 domain-containing protein [Proteobacteria bacterium]|nr:DUF2244 domain-containing protein [Pseudomonadota bacterium]